MDNLFIHFTPNIENLKGILQNGFRPHYCDKFVQYRKKKGKDDDEFYTWDVYPIVGFCNIALSKVLAHTVHYGKFGLAMSPHWAKTRGLNPVIYCEPDNSIAKALGSTIMDGGHIMDETLDTQNNAALLIPYLKNNFGKAKNNKIDYKFNNFIENEWIYSPQFRYYLDKDKSDFDKYDPKDYSKKEIKKANKRVEKFALKFKPEHIKFIIIDDFDKVSSMISFIKANFHKKDAYKLIAKLITVEQLEEDF